MPGHNSSPFRPRSDVLKLGRNHYSNINREMREAHAADPRSHQFAAPDEGLRERTANGFRKATAYLKHRVFKWIATYLHRRFGRKEPFRDYTQFPNGSCGVTSLSSRNHDDIVVSLASDWGSGTLDAAVVSTAMAASKPHFTVHLGDVYYVGTADEIKHNMLGTRVQWPRGSRGTFALNANHEMYARGVGYFGALLPALGQQASYFALRNDHWLVIGLDTGYHSIGIPIVEKIPWFRPSCKQPKAVIEWLRTVLQLDKDNTRGVILLSHHQYYSAFDSEHHRSAKDLASVIKRPVLWFWGHEHRLAFYSAWTRKGGVTAIGRCMGHGGLPIVDVSDGPKKSRRSRPLIAYDRRVRGAVDGRPVGYNGFVNLVFNGRKLTVEYWNATPRADGAGLPMAGPIPPNQVTRQLLLTESWEVVEQGHLEGKGVELEGADESWLHEDQKWQDAQQ